MGPEPDVSVIVTTHNGVAYIERALDSLVRQTIGLDRMQVIVIDDGSTDETPEIVDRFAAEHAAFEVVHQQNAGGPAQPRNLALEKVRGRYVFCLDHDDYLADDALETMVGVADANGTDVVVPRIRSLGGRNTPRLMFSRTIARTDVFHCSAYWVLNPMKLLRMSMVRSVGMRFDLDMPWGEDQTFIAPALLKADGISILADRDYVFWIYRQDRSNITTSVVSLAARMPVVDHMLDYVADNVPPGADRDRLMRRHFIVEVLTSAFEGYRTESDRSAREAAFARFRELAQAYYTERIDSSFPANGRVLMRLVLEDRLEEFGEYLDVLKQAGKPGVLVEGHGVFLALPWFREQGRDLPDPLFDIAESLRLECRTEPLVVEGTAVRIEAIGRLGALTDRVTEVSLVARSRSRGIEIAIPLSHAVDLDEERAAIAIEDTVDAGRLLARLPEGTYELLMRAAAGPTARDRRLNECAPPPAEARVLRTAAHFGAPKSGELITTGAGNLSLRVTSVLSGWRRLIQRARALAGKALRRIGLKRPARG
jgi:glycosyltransferase involved in cell wall biosynthesis